MDNPLVRESEHNKGYFRSLDAGFVRKLFGLKVTARLPNKFVHRVYEGPRGAVAIYIAPKEYGLVNQGNRRAHRIFAVCPLCKRDIPFGRMHQHVKRKDHNGN